MVYSTCSMSPASAWANACTITHVEGADKSRDSCLANGGMRPDGLGNTGLFLPPARCPWHVTRR
jgi:hypothetical protein